MEFKIKTEFLLDIMDRVHDVVWIVDTNLKALYYSKAIEKYGWERDKLIGKSLSLIMTKSSLNKCKELIVKCLKKDNVDTLVRLIETTNRYANSTETYLTDSACQVLYDDDKKIIGFYGIARDITNKRKLTSVNLENEKLKTLIEVGGGVCHEISQPLQIISGSITLIEMGDTNNELEKHLKRIKVSLKRMVKLTKKLQTTKSYKTTPYLSSNIVDLNIK